MHYVMKVTDTTIAVEGELASAQYGAVTVFSNNLGNLDFETVANSYAAQALHDRLQQEDTGRFVFFIWDATRHTFAIYNDHFGSADVLYAVRDGVLYLSGDVKTLFSALHERPVLRPESIYEHLVFQDVQPPDTIYAGVATIPLASCALFANGGLRYHRYWDLAKQLTKKEPAYATLVESVRQALIASLREEVGPDTGSALSGGIDSGGLLGMATAVLNQPVPSVSLGARGESTFDLISARKSVAYHHSPNREIYPRYEDLRQLPEYVGHLNRPICGDTAFAYSYIHDAAAEHGIRGIIYGFGAEMLLGNLKVTKVIARIKLFEWFIPHTIRKPLYALLGKLFHLSKTQVAFLQSDSTAERFMYARGAHYLWQRKYFLHGESLWATVLRKVKEGVGDAASLATGDSVVVLYLMSWVSYLQLRAMSMLGKRVGMHPLLPFDTVRVAHALFRTPQKFRALHHWDKQVLRDVYRPYIPDELYRYDVFSLVIPYSDWFNSHRESLIAYLRGSVALGDLLDWNAFQADWEKLPEPGLFLMRLLGIAVWYDMMWGSGPEQFLAALEIDQLA